MNKSKLYLLLALTALFVAILSLTMQTEAIEVKQTQPSELKVVRSSSEIINGKVVLQPTFNPQQQ